MAKAKLIALLGEPSSVEEALARIAALPADAAIVTDSDVSFAVAAELGRLRTRDRVRTAEQIAASADEVVRFGESVTEVTLHASYAPSAEDGERIGRAMGQAMRDGKVRKQEE